MTEIYDLVEYFIDEYKVLPNGLLVDNSAKIFDDGHDAVQEFEEVWGWYVEPGCCYYIDWWFFEVCEIYSLNVEDWLCVSFCKFYFSIEELGSIFYQVRSEVAVDYTVASSWEEKYLWNHRNYKVV